MLSVLLMCSSIGRVVVLAEGGLVADMKRAMTIVLLVVQTTGIAQGMFAIQGATPEWGLCDLAVEAFERARGTRTGFLGLGRLGLLGGAIAAVVVVVMGAVLLKCCGQGPNLVGDGRRVTRTVAVVVTSMNAQLVLVVVRDSHAGTAVGVHVRA